MIRFQCDYAEGAHPAILEKLVETAVITVAEPVEESTESVSE